MISNFYTETSVYLGRLFPRLINSIKKIIPLRVSVQRLHVFTDDIDTYIAYDISDAELAYKEFVGETRLDSYGDPDPFYQIKDSTPIKIWFEDEDDLTKSKPIFSKTGKNSSGCSTVTAPAWEWILKHGRGFLCSEEY